MRVHPRSDTHPGGRIHTWLLASRMRLRTQLTGGAIAAQHLLDTRETHAQHVGEGTRGPQPPLVGLQTFLTAIDRIRSHRVQASAAMPDNQVQTAIGPGELTDGQRIKLSGTAIMLRHLFMRLMVGDD